MGIFHKDYQLKYIELPPRRVWSWWYISDKFVEKSNDEQHQYYDKLEASILEEGFLNPVHCMAGNVLDRYHVHLRDYIHGKIVGWGDLSKVEYVPFPPKDQYISITKSRGGARSYVSDKYNIPLPCIVLDYINMFPDVPEITTIKELNSYYKEHRAANWEFLDFDVIYQTSRSHEFMGRYFDAEIR